MVSLAAACSFIRQNAEEDFELMADKVNFDSGEQRSQEPYVAPRLVHLDHRATQSGAGGTTTDSFVAVTANTSNAPS